MSDALFASVTEMLQRTVMLLAGARSIGDVIESLVIEGARFLTVILSAVFMLRFSILMPSDWQSALTEIFELPFLIPFTVQFATLNVWNAMSPSKIVWFWPEERLRTRGSEKLIVALQLIPLFPSIEMLTVTLKGIDLFISELFSGIIIVTLASLGLEVFKTMFKSVVVLASIVVFVP